MLKIAGRKPHSFTAGNLTENLIRAYTHIKAYDKFIFASFCLQSGKFNFGHKSLIYSTQDLRFGTDEIGTDEIWTVYLGGPNFINLNFARSNSKIKK